MTTESKSATVFQCISKVQEKMAKEGIGKTSRNTQQGYNFRGIDSVYNALSPILADVGLVIVPSYETRELVERVSASDKALFYVTVKGMYTLASSHDGSTVSAGPFWGEAMDSGDKATNKAMSAAYKYMAMQVFAIPTEGDNDADQTTHEVKAKEKRPEGQLGTQIPLDRMSIERQKDINYHATRIIDAFLSGQQDLALANAEDALEVLWDSDEVAAMWGLLSAPHRTALKTMQKAKKNQQLAAMAGSQG